MATRFAKGEDPTEILQFNFLDSEGRITKESIKSALKPPYPAKYYINVLLMVIALLVFLLWNYGIIQGTKLGFFCNDPLFSHKYRGDTVMPWMLGVALGIMLPGLYLTVEWIRQSNFEAVFSIEHIFEFYVYFKHYMIGLVIVAGVTELAKTIVGEHRPHFFDTCRPDTNLNCTNGTYIFDYTCTNKNVAMLDWVDASRSFPSGHSSISWFTAIFCAYIVQSRLPTHKAGTSFKVFLFAICACMGLVCSLTRITDRRHHWWDVLTGTIIALFGAAYTIRVLHAQVIILHRRIISDQMNFGEDGMKETCETCIVRVSLPLMEKFLACLLAQGRRLRYAKYFFEFLSIIMFGPIVRLEDFAKSK
ncbi:hypothetical protein YQE_08841, partial [Dendroctonus ponderosae]